MLYKYQSVYAFSSHQDNQINRVHASFLKTHTFCTLLFHLEGTSESVCPLAWILRRLKGHFTQIILFNENCWQWDLENQDIVY